MIRHSLFVAIAGVGLSTACAPARDAEDSSAAAGTWLEAVTGRIELTPYRVDPATFTASNPANGLSLAFRDLGVEVDAGEASFRMRLHATAAGTASPGEVTVGECLASGEVDVEGECLRRIELRRPGLVEWYENRPEGLEHGFVVEEPVDELVLDVAFDGVTLEDRGPDEVALLPPDGGLLFYRGLTAWDADGRALEGRMEAVEGGVRLHVDAAGASWPVTVDPVLNRYWTAPTISGFSRKGSGIAGDVNGDGYADVWLADYRFTSGEFEEGAVYVFHGTRTGPGTSASTILQADQISAWFGYAVAAGGDVDGDGFDDLLVGAPKYDAPVYDEGAVFWIPGSAAGLSWGSRVVVRSNQPGAELGGALAVGDADGDARPDFLASVRLWDGTQADEGALWLLRGTASGPSASPSWSVPFPVPATIPPFDFAGDVDADGDDEILLGHPSWSGVQSMEGRVLMYAGAPEGMNTTPVATWTGVIANARLGHLVAGVGDTDRNGYDDVALIAPGMPRSGGNGLARVLLNGPGGATSLDLPTTSTEATSFVAEVGDLDGDGFDDLALRDDQGYVNIHAGSAAGPSPQPRETFAAAPGRGDVNGDGFGDAVSGGQVYFGQPDALTEGPIAFGTYHSAVGDMDGDGLGNILINPSTSAALARATPTGSWTVIGSFRSFSTLEARAAGDVNGDGFGDALIRVQSGSTQRAQLLLGSATGLPSFYDWQSSSFSANLRVAAIADIDGDGLDDFAVADPSYNTAPYTGGIVQVYRGKAESPYGVLNWTNGGTASNMSYGKAVTGCDLNQDGYSDLIVAYSAPGVPVPTPKVAVYAGSPYGIWSSTPIWDQAGPSVSVSFGTSLACGDFDGDGLPELVVGAPSTGSVPGAAYGYEFTGAAFPTSPTWALTGWKNGESFGAALAAVGDVDGDGFGDLLVGSRTHTNGQSEEGRVSLWLGGEAGFASDPHWLRESDTINKRYGTALAASGDLDGDGRADFVIDKSFHLTRDADGDRYPDDYDCNDSDPAVFPRWWSPDADGDGWGSGTRYLSCTPVRGYGYDGDCDDTEPAFHPEASEICDGVDNDCDGIADPGPTTLFADTDGDGYGDPFSGVETCGDTAGLVPNADDCDDTQPETHPGAEEICDGYDNDCDGSTETLYEGYVDGDGDGWGDPYNFIQACSPDDVIADGTDCDDWNAAVNPGAAEICDGIDNDCDSEQDEEPDGGPGYYADWDGDGFGDAENSVATCTEGIPRVTNSDDCDDLAADVHPGGVETCDGRDEDCNGTIDDGVSTGTTWADTDADGYGDPSAPLAGCGAGAENDQDCDDTTAAVRPGAQEVCDGVDQDCDGEVDEGWAPDGAFFWRDLDADTYGDTGWRVKRCAAPDRFVAIAGDCDDRDATVHPGIAEICDGRDDDCDGVTDPPSALGATWYADADGDGWGVGTGSTACPPPPATAAQGGDCDDASAAAYPGKVETCDAVDNDCDGAIDEGWTPDGVFSWRDRDKDGYGDATWRVRRCSVPAGFVADATDCLDTDANAHPGAIDLPGDGIDQDCSGADTPLPPSPWRDLQAADTTIAAATLRGSALQARAGSAIAAGDIDGDGLAELVVAELAPAVVSIVPASVRGDVDLGAEPWRIRSGTGFGKALAVLPDSNGDGMGELAVLEIYDPTTADGAVWLFDGPPGADAVAGDFAPVRLTSYGLATLAHGGDVDDDGVADLLVGAPTWGPSGHGRAWVVPADAVGYDGLDAVATAWVDGLTSTKTLMGTKVSSAGDFDGDGTGDVLVGAPTGAGGRALLFAGPLWGGLAATDADLTWTAIALTDRLGSELADAGDVDGDGLDDVLVGAPTTGVGAGAAWLLRGGTAGGRVDQVAWSAFTGTTTGDGFGRALSSPGDVDGDTRRDVTVGAGAGDGAVADAGAIYVFLAPGPGTHPAAEATIRYAPYAYSALGWTVAVPGDVDGDGFDDVFVGASKWGRGAEGTNRGAAFLFLGQ